MKADKIKKNIYIETSKWPFTPLLQPPEKKEKRNCKKKTKKTKM